MLAAAADAEYDDYVSFQVMPDESILMEVGGSVSEELYYGGGLEEILIGFNALYTCETLTEGSSDIEFRSTIELNPEGAEQIEDLDLLIDASGDSTSQVIDFFVDYPGYMVVDGSMEVNLDDPPYGGSMDLALSTTLYYTLYPKEQIEQLLFMLPEMETMLALQLSYLSDDSLTLSTLEVVSSELGLDSATFKIEGSLEGDFQKGIQAAMENMGAIYSEEWSGIEEVPPLEIESFRANLEFFKESFTFESMFEMTFLGNVDEWTNFVKNSMLDELLKEGYMEEEDEAVINEFLLPTDLSVENMQFELEYAIVADTMTASFNLDGIVLKPPSLEAFTSFLQYVSDERPPEDFVLILEGGSSEDNNVIINSPAGTSEPFSQEPQRIVWSLANAENLDQVTFEVEAPTRDVIDTNLIIAAGGLVVIAGLIGYMFMRRKS
jgi:hypothetical protein